MEDGSRRLGEAEKVKARILAQCGLEFEARLRVLIPSAETSAPMASCYSWFPLGARRARF
jgi:hypothetical protein